MNELYMKILIRRIIKKRIVNSLYRQYLLNKFIMNAQSYYFLSISFSFFQFFT